MNFPLANYFYKQTSEKCTTYYTNKYKRHIGTTLFKINDRIQNNLS